MASTTAMRFTPRRWIAVLLALVIVFVLRYVWTLPQSYYSVSWTPDKVNAPSTDSGAGAAAEEKVELIDETAIANTTSSTPTTSAITQSESSDSKTSESDPQQPSDPIPADPFLNTNLPCASLPGAEDVLVVVKTGATESRIKLPTHFKTTLRCIPHYVIYSDFEEDIDDHHVYDALDDVSEVIKQTNPDFEIYNRMKRMGRAGLESEELTEGTGGTGWRLDKWKFLPLVDKSLKVKPDAKWFVFVEADTYMVWPNMLKWLSQFDPKKPWYMGAQTQIGDTIFAHGGSGFVVSAPAMSAVSARRAAQLPEYDAYTAQEWAGDCVLGKALADVGVQLTWAWPMIQGETPATLDPSSEGWQKRLWCYPALTYHHISPKEVSDMWTFEQDWNRKNPHDTLNHSTVFQNFILPQLSSTKSNWDNLAAQVIYKDDKTVIRKPDIAPISTPSKDDIIQTGPANDIEAFAADSFANCRAACTADARCLQFVHKTEPEGKSCSTTYRIKLGNESKGPTGSVASGWMVDRAKAWAEELREAPCLETLITPS